jgi:hypothetical protein
MNVYMLVLCIFLSVPQTGNDRNQTNPNGSSQGHKTVTPEQISGASYFVHQQKIETAEQQYDPYSDRLYRNYLLATVIGVCFSLIVVGMLIWQNTLTRKVAKAAEDSAKAIANAERAWLMVEMTSTPGYPATSYSEGNSFAPIRIVLWNDGGTPCWVEELRAALAVLDRSLQPPDAATAAIQFTGPMPVRIGKESDPIDFHLDINDTAGLGEHVVVYGVVKYRHPFADKSATTTFAYFDRGGRWDRLYGKYNDHT